MIRVIQITLEVYYQSVVPLTNTYIQQRVLLEMGARSLTEPMEIRSVISFVDRHYQKLEFTQLAFNVQVVIPTRTFIEKALLLHEEFSKPIDKIRTDRLTRHFYDLDKVMKSGYGEKALTDNDLFDTIVEHRQLVSLLRGMDYSNHRKGKLKIYPPKEVLSKWEIDYKTMQENMIVGDSLKWEDLLIRIEKIHDKFNGAD